MSSQFGPTGASESSQFTASGQSLLNQANQIAANAMTAARNGTSGATQYGRKLFLVIQTSSFHSIRGTSLLRYGLILTLPALVALSVLSASPASAATRVTHPSAPRHVTATAGDNSVIVSYVAPASNGGTRITGYYVKQYGRNSAIRRCNSTRCTVLGLSNGVRYRFVVAAINRFGRSAYSTPSNVATPTAPVGTTSTITFDANGGSGVMASETERYNTTAALTLNTFTYTGDSFNDWNSEANGSGTIFANGELVRFNGSVTLYAQWTASAPTTATITFNPNGGTGTMIPETEDLNVSAALTTNSFTRTGYTFSAWNTNANGSGSSFTNGELVQFTASATFYAQWTAVPTPQFMNSSPNWSGYVVPSSSALVTDVSGEWTVPTMNCSATPNGDVSTWVGIGGEQWNASSSSGVLLQTGVDTNCVNGTQQNIGWWEEYPAVPNVGQAFTGFPVSAGNTIEASVFETSSGAWETEVTDLNTGLSAYMITGVSWGVGSTGASTFTNQGSAVNINYSGGYTAEWIVEDPGVANETGSYQPFANFGSVIFSDMRSSFTSWSLTPSEEWGIVQGGATLAAPTSSTTDGFTVTYTGP